MFCKICIMILRCGCNLLCGKPERWSEREIRWSTHKKKNFNNKYQLHDVTLNFGEWQQLAMLIWKRVIKQQQWEIEMCCCVNFYLFLQSCLRYLPFQYIFLSKFNQLYKRYIRTPLKTDLKPYIGVMYIWWWKMVETRQGKWSTG